MYMYNWGERERAPTLLMSMEIVYIRTYVRAYARASTSDRHTAHARERCSNSADLAGFRNQLVWSCLFLVDAGNRTATSVLQKRQERLRDGYHYDSTPDPVCVALLKGRLRHGCCTECCTVCWPAVVSAISLTLAPQCQAFYYTRCKPYNNNEVKCKPSAQAQLLAHGAWLVDWAIIIIAMGAIINTHAHR